MLHICTCCSYEWGTDDCGKVYADICNHRMRVQRARQRIASGHYDRIEVIDATVDRIMDDLDRA